MNDLGIPLTDDLALAAHEGRKTVTRRPMVPQPPPVVEPLWHEWKDGRWEYGAGDGNGDGDLVDVYWPRIPGAGIARLAQRLWVRECWRPVMGGYQSHIEYRAGGPTMDWGRARELALTLKKCALRFIGARADINSEDWHPSIHMPKWAARTWGEIVSVRPERVQDITCGGVLLPSDVVLEGCPIEHHAETVGDLGQAEIGWFINAWERAYPGSWDRNDWVWRIEWKCIDRSAVAP